MSQNLGTGHVPGTPSGPSDPTSVVSRRGHAGLITPDDPAREVAEDKESAHDVSSSEASFQSDADFNRLYDQIKEFADTKVWPGSDAQAIEVQRIPAIYWTLANLSKGDDHYVLRIPNERWGDGDLTTRHTVTQANFARYQASFPVPELSMVNSTKNNILGSSFILEKKASGTMLSEVWDTMTHSDKCQMARELGMYARKMLSTPCAVAGTIAIPYGLGPLEFCVKLAVVSRPDPEFIPPVPEPPSEFFSELKDEGSFESVCELMQRLLRVHLAMAECDYREHWKVQRPCSDMGEMEDVTPEGVAGDRQADETESNETEDEDEDLTGSRMMDALDGLDYDAVMSPIR